MSGSMSVLHRVSAKGPLWISFLGVRRRNHGWPVPQKQLFSKEPSEVVKKRTEAEVSGAPSAAEVSRHGLRFPEEVREEYLDCVRRGKQYVGSSGYWGISSF
jgi:hypothetical protein